MHERGQQERKRISRTRLRDTDGVHAAKRDGPALRLDGGGGRKTGFLKLAENFVGEDTLSVAELGDGVGHVGALHFHRMLRAERIRLTRAHRANVGVLAVKVLLHTPAKALRRTQVVAKVRVAVLARGAVRAIRRAAAGRRSTVRGAAAVRRGTVRGAAAIRRGTVRASRTRSVGGTTTARVAARGTVASATRGGRLTGDATTRIRRDIFRGI